MDRNFGYFRTMALQGVFGGFPRESISNASLGTKRGKLAHAIAPLALLVLSHLLRLLF